MAARPHNEACRKRIEEAMEGDEAGRQWKNKAKDKIDEHFYEKTKAEVEKEEEIGDPQIESQEDIQKEEEEETHYLRRLRLRPSKANETF